MSKQLTPMQELIEYLEKYKEVIGMTAVMIIDKAKSLLPAERKMVEDEMEREAVGFADWKIENYQLWPGRGYYSKFNDGSYGKSHITHTFYTTAQLYQIYKDSK